jgi:hypothetical protein
LRNLNRWDLISVSAFRKTREARGFSSDGGWGSDTPGNATDYGAVMKSSPLSTLLWNNRIGASQPSAKQNADSPSLLPLTRGDGDRTPTTPLNARSRKGNHQKQDQGKQQNPHKTRKELRRDRKMKLKGLGAVHHQHHYHQYHHHHHYPNLKTRSVSSSQRSNFLVSSSPAAQLSV